MKIQPQFHFATSSLPERINSASWYVKPMMQLEALCIIVVFEAAKLPLDDGLASWCSIIIEMRSVPVVSGDQTSCKFIVGFNKSVLLCIYRSCRLEPSELQWWLLLLLLPRELCRFLEPLWSTLQDIQEEVTTSWPCYEENLHGHLSPCSITQSPKPLHLVHLNVQCSRRLWSLKTAEGYPNQVAVQDLSLKGLNGVVSSEHASAAQSSCQFMNSVSFHSIDGTHR